MAIEIQFRPIEDTDLPFLGRLYASTREDEVAMIADWSDQQKQDFLSQQFRAQHTFYKGEFKHAQFDLVLHDQTPIGRLYVDRRDTEYRVIDIALLPAYRGHGLGRKMMQNIINEARSVGKKVTIHVEHNNPAMRLYDRLGFVKKGDTGVYFFMEWDPHSEKNIAEDKS